jgi:hypothetical protein
MSASSFSQPTMIPRRLVHFLLSTACTLCSPLISQFLLPLSKLVFIHYPPINSRLCFRRRAQEAGRATRASPSPRDIDSSALLVFFSRLQV